MGRVTLPTSTLSDLAICVRDILAAIGDPAKVLFGRRHVSADGAPRRVVFVPAPTGKWSRDYVLGGGGKGYVGGVALGCAVYVWGRSKANPAATADDFHRFDQADDLGDIVLNAIGRAGQGNVQGGDFVDAAEADDSKFGEAYRITFTFTRGIQRNRAIFALRDEADPVSPPDLDRPPGAQPSTVETDITETPS